jgi:hypothetical protein
MSPEIDAQFRAVKSWMMLQSADGAYKAETVPPGTYLVEFHLGRLSEGSESFFARLPITVPDSADGETIDLGTVMLKHRPTSQAAR